jgi:Helix-turn-helix domain
MTSTAVLVSEAMIARMRFRDRVCFASKETLAADVGRSPRSVQRAWRELEAGGEWEKLDRLPSGKRVRTCVWRLKRSVRRIRVSQRSSSRRSNPRTPTASRFARSSCALPRTRRGRRRHILESLPGIPPVEGVIRSDGHVTPFTAADVVAALIDVFRVHHVPLNRRYVGMVARSSKELLEDGFDFATVTVAAVTSVRRGCPWQVHHIAQDLAVTKAGQRMGRDEYERMLDDEMDLRR